MSAEKKPKNIKLGDAVSQGIIANETLAYFIGRTWLLFQKIGIDPRRMRFRQHLQVRGGQWRDMRCFCCGCSTAALKQRMAFTPAACASGSACRWGGGDFFRTSCTFWGSGLHAAMQLLVGKVGVCTLCMRCRQRLQVERTLC